MFATIVVGTDGSNDSEEALRAAAHLAQLTGGSQVHVVNAHRPLTPAELNRLAASLPDEMRPLLHAQIGSESILTEARTILQGAGVDAEYHQVSDDPTDAILQVVDEHGADLVIVGSRGEGMAKRVIHGSVSTKVLHHAPCAVLVVKADD
ncbi:MAG: universal stress protein [Acidimicrobiales bacterium]